ncbi:MAG: L-threonylcarbamoyladenylate synthase [Phycisphaerales bacterium]
MPAAPQHPESHAGPEEIARAVAILRAGGVVAFPTETVYGLGADALNGGAVARVFALKGRPAGNPLIVHVTGEEMAGRVAAAWPHEAAKLARAFWPGPLTIVLPASRAVPKAVTAGGPTVAVRCPDHLVTLSLLEAFGGPLVGPSANPSGRVSPTTAAHVREVFSGADVFVLEGGPCRGGIESTVVSLVSVRGGAGSARVLRPGLIGAEELSIVLGHPVEEGSAAAEAGPAPSPGMQEVHYAPAARAVVFEAGDLGRVLASAPRVEVLTHSGLIVAAPHTAIGLPSEANAYAARLYAALREADALKPDLIAIERPPAEGAQWAAVADRLARAAKPFRP